MRTSEILVRVVEPLTYDPRRFTNAAGNINQNKLYLWFP
jgi:hypothetical protein